MTLFTYSLITKCLLRHMTKITTTSTTHVLCISLSTHYVIMHVYALFLIVDYSHVQPHIQSST